MPEVTPKWVSSYQIGIHKSEDCDVPIFTLDQIEAWLRGNQIIRCGVKSKPITVDDLLAQVQAWKANTNL